MGMTMQARRLLLVAFIVSISACGLLGIIVLLRGNMGAFEGRILGTTALVSAASIVGMASAFLWERRHWHPIGLLGLFVSPAALVTTMPLIWIDVFPNRVFEDGLVRLTGVLWVTAVALPYVGLFSFARLHKQYGWIRRWTVVAIIILAGLLISLILWQPDHNTFEAMLRLIGVLAIASVCGTLAVPVFHYISKMARRASQRTTDLQIEINCPRCTTRQIQPVGRSECANCRLKFAIEIEEEQCPKCGYPCYLLTSSACPECGTTLAAGDAPPAST